MHPLSGLALFALAALPGPVVTEPEPTFVEQQVTVRQRIIVRVPRMAPSPVSTATPARIAPPRPILWEEKSGPRCVPVGELAGAQIGGRRSVDLVLAGGKRLRARLDNDCPALDFYRGFYLKPNRDGMVCADRDIIRSRAGGECEIDSFRRLVPKR